MTARFGHRFGNVTVSPRQPQLAASPLTIGPVDDPLEREAEQVANGDKRGTSKGKSDEFSAVRIHTDTMAAESAAAVQARAYTVGNQIVFGEGQYQPATNAGQRLLAHELTHTVQQIGVTPSQGQTLQRAPDPAPKAPEGEQPTATPSTAAAPQANEPARPESKLTWKWKDLLVYPLLIDIWKDLISKELTSAERKELKLTGNEAAAFYNWAFAVGLAAGGLGGEKAEGKDISKDFGTVNKYAEALQGVTPSSDAILDPLSRLVGLRLDKYLASDLFLTRLKTHSASVVTLAAVAQGIVSTVAAVSKPSEAPGEMMEHEVSKHFGLIRFLANKIFKEQLKAPSFFDVAPLQLSTHPAFAATPFAGGAIPSGATAEGKKGVGESGEELKFGLTLNLPRLLGNKDALDPTKYRGWQTSVWFNYDKLDPTETMKQAGKLPESKLKGGVLFGGAGLFGLLEAGARYGDADAKQLTSWFLRGGYGFAGDKDSVVKKIGFTATYVDWKETDALAPGKERGAPTAGQALQVSPFTSLQFATANKQHRFDVGAALSFVSGSEENATFSGGRGDFSYTYLGKGTEQLPAFKLDLSGSVNRLDWHNPNSPLLWGLQAKATAGRFFGGGQVSTGAQDIPAGRAGQLGEAAKVKVPTAVIFSAGYAF